MSRILEGYRKIRGVNQAAAAQKTDRSRIRQEQAREPASWLEMAKKGLSSLQKMRDRKGGVGKQSDQKSNITSTLFTFTVDFVTSESANAEPHFFAASTNGRFSSMWFAKKAPRRRESARFPQGSGFVHFLLKRLLQLFAEEARLRLLAPCEFFPPFLVLGVARA